MRIILLICGSALLGWSALGFWQRNNPERLKFKGNIATATTSAELLPIRLEIEKQNIDLTVIPARVTKNNWETTDRGVSYLVGSGIVGGIGNAVFYGHNWKSLLGNLSKIKPGDSIKVGLNNSQVENFIVEYTSIIDPTQTHILYPSNDRRITIYTCAGLFDSKRFVAVALKK
jgi:sortase (surface protein transpeptidase)